MTEDETDEVPLSPGKHEQPGDEAGTEPFPDGPAPHRTRVMLLGSDELGRELVLAFQRIGAEVIAVERYANAPAHGVADQALVVKMTDADELSAVIERLRPNYVVTATDVVAGDALTAAGDAGFTEVVPTARSARLTADREGMRRLAADELGLPTAPFWFAGSVDELDAVARHAGFPLRVQPVA
ncbi:MAG: NAD-dependent epimerase/dehydratase family protein, partial [Acidimicrobiales bacterium]